MAIKNSKKIFNDEVVFKDQMLDCVEDADCCIIMSDWDEYSLLDSSLCKNMKNKLVIDARRILNKEKFDGEIKFIAIGSN